MWNEERMLKVVERYFERVPTEMCWLNETYLLEEWGLVALGITTAIADIVLG